MMLATTTKGEETQSSSSLEQPCHVFTLAEILSATHNFDEELCIGRGGFGKVYKGVIKDGTTCAIKRLHSFSNQGALEFWAEVKMLSRLRHCNLVSLIGYCNDEKEMALVYDYMPNGTLEDCLHKKGTVSSTWLQLLKICIGTARGLDYLHTGTGTQHGVIHRDVKSSNILLDETYAAKVSDFGLAKITQINQTLTHVSTQVKGTFGYMDPSYFYTGKLTRKSDVYAFGVILLEVLCRRPATDSSLDEGLAMWAQDRIKQGKLNQIIDSSLREQISTNSVKEFSRIAIRCLLSRPNQRPTMGEVIASLELALSLQERRDSSRRVAINKMWSFLLPKGRSKFKLPTPTHALGREGIEVVNKVEDDNADSEPAIEGLKIIGNTFLEEELQACGNTINGTSLCMFQWVRHLSDGTYQYIEGATYPTYTVTSDDVGSYLAVEVVPMDDNGRQGKLVECFVNDKKKITTLELLDSFFQECCRQGEFMVLEGFITVKEIEDAKSAKDSGRVISVGLPAYCLYQSLLRSAKANSTGILLLDNGTEITSANRPKDTFFHWFLNPVLVLKEQLKAQNLTESEEEYLGKLVLLSGDAQKLKNSNIGPPPESELRRAELDALAQRLQVIAESILRYPTYKRHFESSMKAISEELDKRNGSGN